MWHLGSNRTTMSGPKSRTGNRARSSPPGPTHRRRPSHRAGAPFSRPQVASRLPAGPSRVFTLVLIRAKGGSRLAPPPLAPATVVAERQLSLGERPGNHGLLDQATEDEPTTAGAASVEAERELLQVGLQVGRGDSGAQLCPVSRVQRARCARQPMISGARALRGRYPAPGNERVGSRAA